MNNEQKAIHQWLSKPYPQNGACGCMGPRNGEPLCPCAMKWVEKVDGVYYRIEEHRSPYGVTHTAEKVVIKDDPFLPKKELSLEDRLKNYKEKKKEKKFS